MTSRSRLYACEMTHVRAQPARRVFTNRFHWFCLDVDEIPRLATALTLFGVTAASAFRFAQRDFWFAQHGKIKAEMQRLASAHGIHAPIHRVELLGHMRTLGYAFNPAAFYFAYDINDELLFSCLEVTNTYREKKVYFVAATSPQRCVDRTAKNFYVSPFVAVNTDFALAIGRPGGELDIAITSLDQVRAHVTTRLRGTVQPLTNATLRRLLVSDPLVTFKTTVGIHAHALVLYLRKVPYFAKVNSAVIG